jgi:hypothetical protein
MILEPAPFAVDGCERQSILPLIHEDLRLFERAKYGGSEKNRMFVEQVLMNQREDSLVIYCHPQ